MLNSPLADALAQVTLGPEIVFKNLVMLPLLARRPEVTGAAHTPTDYLLLDDALEGGGTEITEVSEQGSVPELRLVNRGAAPVLIVDGEELVGAKQNRVVNLTLLVPARTSLTIPVSCVEAGRWRARSRAFSAAPRTQYASGRAKRMRSVTTSMLRSGAYCSDQAEVWADIADKAVRLEAHSATSAMEALFTGHAEAIDAFVEACRPVDGQIGALFLVNGQVASLDLFDREPTLRRLLPKLVRSCAIDALDGGAMGTATSNTSCRASAKRFVENVISSPQHVAKALGLGDDVRVTGAEIAAAALIVDGRAVHIGAFAGRGADVRVP
jgi:hypothetical protein